MITLDECAERWKKLDILRQDEIIILIWKLRLSIQEVMELVINKYDEK